MGVREFDGKLDDVKVREFDGTLDGESPKRKNTYANDRAVYDPVSGAPIGEADPVENDLRSGLAMGDEKRTKYSGRVLDSDIPGISVGSVARDILAGTLKIAPTAIKGVAEIGRLATGDRIGVDTSHKMQADIDKISEDYGSSRSKAQALQLAQDMKDPALNAADVIVGNKGALADQVLPTVGSMFLPAGAGALAEGLAGAGNAAKLAGAIDAATLASRLDKARTAAVIGTVMAQNAADTYSTIRDAGGQQDQSYLGAAISMPFSYLAGRLTEGGAENIAAKMLAGEKLAGRASREIPKAIAKESAQEMGEQVGQSIGETVGKGEAFDLNNMSKEVAVAGALGGLVGGGVTGAGHIANIGDKQPPNTQALPEVGTLSRAANAVAQSMAEAGVSSINDGDILNPAGEPFKNKVAAAKALTNAGEGHEIVPVAGGFVVRPQDVSSASEVPAVASEADGSGVSQPAGSVDAGAGRVDGAVPAMESGLPRAVLENSPVRVGDSNDAVSGYNAALEDLAALKEDLKTARGEYRAQIVEQIGIIESRLPELQAAMVQPDTNAPAQTIANDPAVRQAQEAEPIASKQAPTEAPIQTQQSDSHAITDYQQASDSDRAAYDAATGTEPSIVNPENYASIPVAESQAPEKSAISPRESGDGGVAPNLDAGGLESSTQPSVTVNQTVNQPAETIAKNKDHIGIGAIPINDGGKPFKNKKAAQTAKKDHPFKRIKAVDGGGVLADKTPAQIAAQEKAAKLLSQANTGDAGKPMSAHEFIIREGGLNRAEDANIGIGRNLKFGNRYLYAAKGNGLTIEQAAMKLKQAGYIDSEDHTLARDVIKRSAFGSPVYTADGMMAMAEAEAQTRYEDHLAAEQENPTSPDAFVLTAEELAETGYTEEDPQTQAEVRALIAKAESIGIDAESILEDVAKTTENATRKEYNHAAKAAIESAIAAIQEGTRNRSEDSGQAGTEAGRTAGTSEAQQVTVEPRANGTLAVKGDPKAVREQLTAAGIPTKSMMPMDGGILVGKTQAEKAKDYLKRVEKAAADAKEAAKTAPKEVIEPAQDEAIGQNVDGEPLYRRANGEVYRIDSRNGGKPSFGGFLEPIAQNNVAAKDQIRSVQNQKAKELLEQLSLADRHKAIDAKLDSMNDAEIRALYERMNLAGQNQDAETLRDILKNEHPDDIEPMLSGSPLLSAPTQSDIEAKQDREANAQALDDKAQIDREASGFTLQAQTQDNRKDTTGDMFGGPSVADFQAAAQRKPAGTESAGPDLFSEPQSKRPQAKQEQQGPQYGDKFTVDIGSMFGNVPYRASAPVAAPEGGEVLSSKIIVKKTPITKDDRQDFGDQKNVFAWRVSAIKNKDGGIFAKVEAMTQDHGRTPDGEVVGYFTDVRGHALDALGRIAPSISRAAQQAYDDAVSRNSNGDLLDADVPTNPEKSNTSAEPAQETAKSEQVKKQEPAAKGKQDIQDFGEKIEGAKKDQAPSLSKELSDDAIATEPFSKIWPADEIDKMQDTFAAAVATAARAEVPAKPRVEYKLKSWVLKVKKAREIAQLIASGKLTREEFLNELNKRSIMSDFKAKVLLLEQLPREQWKRIGGVNEWPNAVQYQDGKQVSTPIAYVKIDGKDHRFEGTGRILDSLNKINELLGVAPQEKRMGFQVRGPMKNGNYFINYENDSQRRHLKEVATAKEGHEFIRNNYADLAAAWEAVKAKDNVGERDVRPEENRQRSAEDWRKGKDVTTEQFSEQFGFRGVQFGNWVGQGKGAKDRQGMLNMAYDALMDLASIIGVPPKALSLNGSLGLSFGARGSGWASAHYEPGNLVINLTKTRGAGTLAHEWFHALDNYFQLKRGETSDARSERYITYSPETYYENAKGQRISEREFNLAQPGNTGNMFSSNEQERRVAIARRKVGDVSQWRKVEGVRPEVAQAFADLVKALEESPMSARSKLIDAGKAGYWSRIIERAARSFENYVISKMMEKGYHNDYLANVTTLENFARDKGRYPYLMPDEVKPIADAFDNLFGAIETKETDKGVAMFKRAPQTIPTGGMPLDNAQRVVDDLTKNWKDGPPVHVVDFVSELPVHAPMDTRGLYLNGEIWIVASANKNRSEIGTTLAHEAIAHYGLKNMLGEDWDKFMGLVLRAIKSGNKPLKAIQEQVRKNYVDGKGRFNLTPTQEADEIAAKVVEQAVSENGEFKPGFGFVKSVYAKIVQFLRSMGLNITLTHAELQGALVNANKLMERGRTEFAPDFAVAASRSGQVENTLQALSKADDFFALPKSDKTSLEDIVAENDPTIQVSKSTMIPGETRYNLTMPSGERATISVRTPTENSPYAMEFDGENQVYNVDTMMPGENPEDAPNLKQVWLDVSNLKATGEGQKVYNIAGTFAHNNDMHFIGDPAGLSDDAMRRRPELMLSSALKFGTTRHLVPHPRQTMGDSKLGLPALRWVYGDDVGNIQRLIDVNLKNLENDINESGLSFRPSDGAFLDASGQIVARDRVVVPARQRGRAESKAGSTTLARGLILRALLREQGQEVGGTAQRGRYGVLDELVRLGQLHPQATQGIFYSRAGIDASEDSSPTPDDIAKVKRLGAAVARALDIAEPDAAGAYRAVSLPEGSNLRAIASAFGKTIVGYSLSPVLKGKKSPFSTIGGVSFSGIPNTVFVNLDSDRPHLSVLGHELAHELRRDAPDMYRELVDAIRPFVNQPVYRTKFPKERVAIALANESRWDEMHEEFIGEVLSDGFTENTFWNAIGEKSPKLLSEIVGALGILMDKIRRVFGSQRRTSKYLADFNRVMEIAGEAMSKYAVAPKAANPEDSMKFMGKDTIEVDGVDRPTKNSNGQPIVYRGRVSDGALGMRNGVAYFTDSRSAAESFPRQRIEDEGYDGSIRIMEARLDLRNPASEADVRRVAEENGLALLHPDYPVAYLDGSPELVKALKAAGYDGAVGLDGRPDTGQEINSYAVFDAGRVRPATGNNGSFNPANPDIRFARGDFANKTVEKIGELAASDLFAGKTSYWHKSVGTMFNLAQRSPAFKKVFDAVQNLINDTSYYATESANMAPSLLPKLETWRDINKKAITSDDANAIKAPIFEGTLSWARDERGRPVKVAELEKRAESMTAEQKSKELLRNKHISPTLLKMWQGLPVEKHDAIIETRYKNTMLRPGVVFKDSELKSLFNLNDRQIGLYHEFRNAVDTSIDNLTLASMVRAGGEDLAPIRDVLLSMPVAETEKTATEYLESLKDGKRDSVLDKSIELIQDLADRATTLKRDGYAPLSRFGSYTVSVYQDGELEHFGMYESVLERVRAMVKLRKDFPGAEFRQGTMSQEQHKLYQGITPDTAALFGDILGLDATGDSEADKAFQTYLKTSVANQSAMKRMIHRKGIAGFNEDAGRVLAAFVYSNARQTAKTLHTQSMLTAADEIPNSQGELKDAAIKLVDYVRNPQEEAQAFRSILFAQYIGGSVASALVNMMQPLMMTFPYLSQFGGVKRAAATMAKATKLAVSKRIDDKALADALKRAEEDGTVSPQEVHQLMQQASGGGVLKSGDGTLAGNSLAKAQNTYSRVLHAWGVPFSLAEQLNRRITFIAAYQTATEQGMDNPDAFARTAISETQGLYNKGNKPRWARGVVGSVLFTFKQYSVAYVEMLHRLATAGKPGSAERAAGRKAALTALAVLWLVSGLGGLPGADDLDDVISGLLQTMGYNVQGKLALKEFMSKFIGNAGAEFMMSGVTGIPGAPLDVSGRLGLGNLIPGTGYFQKKKDHTQDLKEFGGAAGDFIGRAFDAAAKAMQLDFMGKDGAVATASPKAAQNMIQAADMLKTDSYRDSKGRKVIDTTPVDAAVKFAGFQPQAVKRVQDAGREQTRMIELSKLKESDIADKWAKARFEGDDAGVESARAELRAWNEKNPETPIRIDMTQIARRLRDMRMNKEQRIEKAAPKELRRRVREMSAHDE